MDIVKIFFSVDNDLERLRLIGGSGDGNGFFLFQPPGELIIGDFQIGRFFPDGAVGGAADQTGVDTFIGRLFFLPDPIVEVVKKTKANFIPYEKQLKDKRWRRLRTEVIEERGGKCEVCGSSANLCVHHKVYIKGRYAWEYPKKHLLVLCNGCHEKVHGIDLDKRADLLIEND